MAAFLLECQMKDGQVLVFLDYLLLDQFSVLTGVDSEEFGVC